MQHCATLTDEFFYQSDWSFALDTLPDRSPLTLAEHFERHPEAEEIKTLMATVVLGPELYIRG